MTTATRRPVRPAITETHALLALLRAADVPADVIAAGGIDGRHITDMIYGSSTVWAAMRADIAAGATPADVVDAYRVTPGADDYPTWDLHRRIPAPWPSIIMAVDHDATVAHVPAVRLVAAGDRFAATCGAVVGPTATGDALALCVACHAHIAPFIA